MNSGAFASLNTSKIKLSAVVKNAPAFIILYKAVDLSIGLWLETPSVNKCTLYPIIKF